MEQIDNTGSSGNTLLLDVSEVLNISSHSNRLLVGRDNDGTGNCGSGWIQQADDVIGTDTCEVFTRGAATLKVQSTAAATITGRHSIYDNSFFDSDPTSVALGSGGLVTNTNDDYAIASDKMPLLPGGFVNYTSYSNDIADRWRLRVPHRERRPYHQRASRGRSHQRDRPPGCRRWQF